MKFSPRLVACSISLALLPALTAEVSAQNARVCVYDSQTYSEGAAVCVRSNLMINCGASGERMVWTIVADRDTARLCGGGEASSRYYRRASRVAARVAPAPAKTEAGSSKCFAFNGRQYCE
jgi:hypothetical protein